MFIVTMKVGTVGDVHFHLIWFWLNVLDSCEELAIEGMNSCCCCCSLPVKWSLIKIFICIHLSISKTKTIFNVYQKTNAKEMKDNNKV